MLRFALVFVLVSMLVGCDLASSPAPNVPSPSPTLPKPTETKAAVTVIASNPTTLPSPRPTIAPSHTIGPPSRTPAAVHTPSPTPQQYKTNIPASIQTSTANPTSQQGMEVVATGFGSPDDLTISPSGDILFGDFANNALNIIRPGESPSVLAAGFNEPEGIIVAKDGAIIVAEQGTNRIIEVDANNGAKKVLHQLVNKTGQDGVDGLGLDPATDDILIPDSPNGRLLRMSRDGQQLQVIATGFVRPTGAAVESDGSILVADEFGNAVYRLTSAGKRTKIADIYQPDDVITGPDGSIYVNSLGGTIVRIDPTSGQVKTLQSGLKLPHGLGIDLQGNLIIAEAGRNRILKLTLARP